MANDNPPKPSKYTRSQLQQLAIQIAGEDSLRITINGTSMEPALSPGDAILVAPSKDKEPVVGQIVTFKGGETLVTHRIVGKTQNGYLLKGDNAQSFDPITPADEMIGVVVAVNKKGDWQSVKSNKFDRMITTISLLDGKLNKRFSAKKTGLPRYFRAGLHRILKAMIRLMYILAS